MNAYFDGRGRELRGIYIALPIVMLLFLFFGCNQAELTDPAAAPPQAGNAGQNPSPNANIPAGTAIAKPSCEGNGLFGGIDCSRKCKETEECKIQASPYKDLTCYACKPKPENPWPCGEHWDCSAWDDSGKGVQYGQDGGGTIKRARTCKDKNACGTTETKPDEEEVLDLPDFMTIVDGTPSDKFIVGQNSRIGLRVEPGEDGWELPIRAYLRNNEGAQIGSGYEFYGKDNAQEGAPGAPVLIRVQCPPDAKCEAATDWGNKIVTLQKTSGATVDWTFLWGDGEYVAPVDFGITPKDCAESWSCGAWQQCVSGVQSRICADANSCGTTASRPVAERQCTECVSDWRCNDWGACAGGTQARTCNDWNNCGNNGTRPEISRSCQTPVACSENWVCDAWGAWGSWGACSEAGSQSRTRTRGCTDTNACGTVEYKSETTQAESQPCAYTPTQQKPEYSAHESALGSKISNLDYNGANENRDLSATGGEYGYRILGIPSHVTITVCVSADAPFGFVEYPQYHYGFDFTDTTPGCTDIYNKNSWANGLLVHLGDPTPANVNAHITVVKK